MIAARILTAQARTLSGTTLRGYFGKAWVTQFLATRGGESSCMITRIGTHLTQSTTGVTVSSSK